MNDCVSNWPLAAVENNPPVEEGGCCPHFGECGGCHSQDLPYPQQLAHKEALLRGLFAGVWEGPIPVEPSPTIWHYRNKLDLNFGRKHYPAAPPPGFIRESVLGFKQKGRWYWPVDIQECRIGPETLPALLDAVREWMRGQGLRAYDPRSREGGLRYLIVREGKRSGERMVVVIARDRQWDAHSFVGAVREAGPVTSIYRGVYQGEADNAAADELELLYGVPAIDEELRVPDGEGARRLRFRLSPFSFFQTNTLATERLYGTIRRWVKPLAPGTLYDLYGGGGGIAFTCADLAGKVVSVESVDSAARDGVYNAEANTIGNVSFLTQKVEEYLLSPEAGNEMGPGSVVIVDPPRAGLHPKALRRLVELAPSHIIHVSCKPSVLAEEMKTLLERYTLRELVAFDLFPHTPHVEALVRLERR